MLEDKQRDSVLAVRQALSESVEMMLQKVVSYKEDGKNDSEDLFAEIDDDIEEEILIPRSKMVSEVDVLLKEKEFLGLYVTDNPVIRYTPFLQYLRATSGKDNLYLVLINKIKKIFTKSKDMMFAIEISIDGEKCEAVIFSKNAARFSSIIQEQQLFWIKGKISTPRKKAQPKIEAPVLDAHMIDDSVEAGDEGEPIAGGTEVVEVKEFVELPKLIIDGISPFDKGFVAMFEGDDNGISFNVEEMLQKLDYSAIKNDPYKYESYLGNGGQNSEVSKKEPELVKGSVVILKSS
jgi:hypothetical protein